MDNVIEIIGNTGDINEVTSYFDKIFNTYRGSIVNELVTFFGEDKRELIEKRFKETAMIFYFDLNNYNRLRSYTDNYLFNLRFEYTIKLLKELEIDTSNIYYNSLTKKINVDDKNIEDFLITILGEKTLIYDFDSTNVVDINTDLYLREEILDKYIKCLDKKSVLFSHQKELKILSSIYNVVYKNASSLKEQIDNMISVEEILSPLCPGSLLMGIINDNGISRFDAVNGIYNINYKETNSKICSSSLYDKRVITYNVFGLNDYVIIKEIINSISSELLVLKYDNREIRINKQGIGVSEQFGKQEYNDFNDLITTYISTLIVDKLHQKGIYLFKNHLLVEKNYYEYNFIFDKLFSETKDDFCESLINVDCHRLEESIGKDNLRQLVHLCIECGSENLKDEDSIIRIMKSIKAYKKALSEKPKEQDMQVKEISCKVKILKKI